MGLNLKILKMSPALFAWQYNAESFADQTDHFANVFVCENVAYGYEAVTTLCIWKYTANAILFREIQLKKMDTLMF